MNEFTVKIERIVPEGKGFGLFEGKPVYVLGAYPDEEVKVRIISDRKDFLEAEVIEVIKPSEYRIEPVEDHYLVCSPWETIDYKYQLELKKDILLKCFKSLAGIEVDSIVQSIEASPKTYGYRNKLEFSFGENEDKSIFLAFHKRGSHKHLIELKNGCALGDEKMNAKALEILEVINQSGLEEFDLKSLTIRYSFASEETIALLLFKNTRERVEAALKFFEEKGIDNLTIALSDFRSPVARIDKILLQKGKDFLVEEVSGTKFMYYLDSFFQNNIGLFEKTIEDLKKFVIKDSNVLELYSGVGSIGLNLSNQASKVTGVEIVESAVKAAKENIKINEVKNYESILLPAEKIDTDLLDGVDILVLDPPRSGLHQKLIDIILHKKPEKIIYLSCNPITQASDLNKLKELYEIKFLKGYDFYPNTPHLEALLILTLKN